MFTPDPMVKEMFAQLWPYFIGMAVFVSGTVIFTGWYRRNVLKIRDGGYALEDALKEGEGATIEFKSEANDGMAKTIGAFANGRGGTIFVGVGDSGRVIGLPVICAKDRDRILLCISNMTRQRIDPPTRPACDFVEFEGKTVLKIWVRPTGDPLHYVDGVAYLRHINTTQKATAFEIFRIYQDHFTRRKD